MNKNNFSKYLEQRDPELYEQMFNEGIHDIIGKGVDWIQKKNQEYFPDQVRKDGKWINKPVEPQAPDARPQAPDAKQQDTKSDDNYLRSFKVLYNAVKEKEANDDFFDGLKRNNISLPRYYKMLETRLFEEFKDLWKIYFGQDMSDKGIYDWEKSPLFGKKIQVYLKLKNLVKKGKKSGSHPDNKPINKDDDNYDLGGLDAVEHHNPTFKKIIFLRDAKKQLLNSEG